VALAGIPPWQDQSIELFHGTTDQFVFDVMSRVDVNAGKGKTFPDFGSGFYTTTRFDKARLWADDRARRLSAAPAAIQFQVSREALAHLECLIFVRGDSFATDYWSFVQYCRTGGSPTDSSSMV